MNVISKVLAVLLYLSGSRFLVQGKGLVPLERVRTSGFVQFGANSKDTKTIISDINRHLNTGASHTLFFGDAVGLTGATKPGCARTRIYCPYDHGYPIDKVNSIIDRYYNDLQILYQSLYQFTTQDELYKDNATLGYRQDGHFVCGSVVESARLGWAQNTRGQWLVVINTDKFPQSVRIETCKYGGRRCEYLPPCYKSTCIQRSSYAKLIAIDPTRPSVRPRVETFLLPSACSCFVENFTYY
ncbi:unnamed protein product [Meganyctiphanes norvegica]|uniref:Spaetzle domain-containing protein n=1 Tax=Meganyctiphanes norvegica TaxID=48144 RepID=A0AAV2S494_MEGNR